MGSRRGSLGIVAVVALALTGCPATPDDAVGPTVDPPFDAALPRPAEGGFPDPPRPSDGAVDARPDGPDAVCTVGSACDPDRGCEGGECIPELATESYDLCTGEMSTEVSWEGGYCVPRLPAMAGLEACAPEDPSSCPPCSRCVDVGLGQRICMQSCELTATTGGGCRRGYECQFGDAVCAPGCTSDGYCRIYREDTNMDGTISAEGMPPVDRLRCDLDSRAVCNPLTSRCEQPSGGGAAGSPCDRSSQCEANGTCIAGWPGGGYCSKLGCSVPGRECEGEGKCQTRFIGLDVCGQPCTVFAEAGTADALGELGHGAGCRPGYACFWDGVGGEGEPGNGICLPGSYNAVTVPNVGAGCDPYAERDLTCWSPFGAGRCLGGIAVCSVLDCAAPGAPTDLCGPGAVCLVTLESGAGTPGVPDLGACFQTCASAEDCTPGTACVAQAALVATTDPGRVCFALCAGPRDCRTGERCAFDAAGSALGTCEPL